MEEKNSAVSTSTNFLSNLFLLFLGLKLAGFIDWSWWWVFTPIWAPALLVGIITVIAVVATMAKGEKNGKNKR